MKYLAILLSLVFNIPDCQLIGQVNHADWNDLLSSHVSNSGKVNYTEFREVEPKLNAYLNSIASSNIPSNKDDALALWINAYNSYTIKLIIANWPVSSIKDVAAKVGASTPWDHSFAKIAGKTYTLNEIEHEIIRKTFDEPRIHFAVNCAAKSCPPLLNRAFIGSKLDEQLETQTKKFINNSVNNTLNKNTVTLSKIFEWFKDDFTKNGSLISFINKYADTKISESSTVGFHDYSWILNN